MNLVFALFLGFLVCDSRRDDYSDEALRAAITSLPGLDANTLAKYTMFSGYIDVFPSHNRSIFYWFIESLNKPTTDPVAVWTNGGPGASGLIGMFTEQGPFRPFKNLTLYVNDYSWVNVANMIFIEAPAGVGFSFSQDSSDYTTNDNKTAVDNYHFIQGWLKTFPNFQSNDFYITSESYGGHYMPTLAQQIIIGNAAGGDPQINFKGIFVGNPYTDPIENQKGSYDTYFGHQMVSLPVWQTWFRACGDGNTSSTACSNAKTAVHNCVGNNIDHYALDYPVCHSNSKDNEVYLFYKNSMQNKDDIPLKYREMIAYFERFPNEQFYTFGDVKKESVGIFPPPTTAYYDPCEENYMTTYLNQASVQAAIHVVPKHWPGTQIHYSGSGNPMEPTWKWIIANAKPALHLTIVSGDDDTVCGTLGTQSWIWDMGFTPTNNANWVHWTDSNGQTGGYLLKFQNAMNLVTVHSAGHMIPECQPSRSLQSFTRYLSGEF